MYPREKLRKALTLYAVTDDAWLEGRTFAECVEEALRGGATFVQLRDKEAPSAIRILRARALAPLCQEAGVPLVINDDVAAALSSDVDGVHVGQSDAACAEARKTLGPDKIVGVSVSTVAEALAAEADGADYVGVGAVASTSTKPEADVIALEDLRAICDAVSIPVVAIGGLNEQTIPNLAGTGVDGVAVVSALFAAEDIEAAARNLKNVTKETLCLETN